MPGIVIRDVLNNVPNTCTFRVDGKSNLPVGGEKINIIDAQDGDRLLFAGLILSVDQIYEEITSQLAWDVTCIDFTWLLNRRRPYGTYNGVSASEIVKDLVARFAQGFTTAYVQSDLAPISILFDGTQDFNTCLNRVAEAIGGGHWYVDYDQDVHFFHQTPPAIQLPDFPESVVTPGPIGSGGAGPLGGALTFSLGPYQSNVIWSAGPDTYAFFQVTYVYDNGAESAYGPATAPVLIDQTKIWNFSNIPIGLPAGSLNVTMRRIYITIASNNWRPPYNKFLFSEVRDNVTTTLQTAGFVSGTIRPNPVPKAPLTPYVAPPVGPTLPVTATTTSTLSGWPYFNGGFTSHTWTPGYYSYAISYIYADMTESLPGVFSAPFYSDGQHEVRLNNLPIGPDLNGVPVIARRVYTKFLGQSSNVDAIQYLVDTAQPIGWDLIPDNTSLAYDTDFGLGGKPPTTAPVITPKGPSGGVQWPNTDGPNLEDTLPTPVRIDADNTYLLRDPPFRSSSDLSQVRNRIYVRGVGTQLTEDAPAGATQLTVAELAFFSTGGGKVYIDGQVMTYAGVSAPEGPGVLIMVDGIARDLVAGNVVNLFCQVDSESSQEIMGRLILDKDGNQTDGIHEFTIVDTSLQSPLECYMRGAAELELFAFPVTSISYSTRDPNTRSGRIVEVDLTDPPCVGDFLIQDVTIDQIHDESDDVSPRYNVRASSIKFDLNDLLLKIIDQNPSAGMGGSSARGLLGTAGASASALDPLTKRVGWYNHTPVTGGLVQYTQAGLTGCDKDPGGAAPIYDSTGDIPNIGKPVTTPDHQWVTMKTGAAVDNTSGILGQDWVFVEDNFEASWNVRTGNVVNDLILWCGFQTTGLSLPTTKSGTNVKFLTFRFAPRDGDGGWVGVLQEIGVGHTQYVTRALSQVMPNTEYLMRIRTGGGPTWDNLTVAFQVDNHGWETVSMIQTATSATPSWNMPSPNDINQVGLVMMVGVVNKGATQKRFSWRRFSLSRS